MLRVRKELLAEAVAVQKANGLTQQVIARRAQINAGYLSLLMRGERQNIREDKAQRLADVLGVPLGLLFLSDVDATMTRIAS